MIFGIQQNLALASSNEVGAFFVFCAGERCEKQ